MEIGFLFRTVGLVSWGGALVLAGILALRGGRSWPAAMMIVAGICQALGFGVSLVGSHFQSKLWMSTIVTSSSGGTGMGIPASISEHWSMRMIQGGGIAVIVGLVLFLTGLIPLCLRYGAMHKRAVAAEELNRQLQERLQD